MPERLRISHLVYSLDIQEGGGITRTAIEMVKKLNPERFKASIASLGYPGSASSQEQFNRFRQQGIEVYEPGGWNVDQPYRSFYRSLLALRDEFARHPVDILHSHSEFSDISAIGLRILGSTAILLRTVHYPYIEEWKKRPVRRLLLTNSTYPILFDAEVAVNQIYTERLNQRWIARILKRRARCIHSAIQLDRFKITRGDRVSIRSSLGIPANATVVGTIGRLAEQKGYKYLIAAATWVLQRNPETYFLIIGDGPLASQLRQQASQLGVSPRVQFTGGRTDVEDLLAGMDLFVSSSLWEGLPAVVLESMASGVPVIATDIPGTREVIQHGSNGWLVPAANAQALGEAILKLASDVQLREGLVKQGHLRVTDFSMESLVSRYDELYQELWSRRRGRGSA